MKFLLVFIILFFLINFQYAQSFVFAQLTGSPTMNTTGWNLTGNAYVGDTGGDTDGNSNELILTDASNGQSGGIFYNQSIDLSTCYQWKVEFDFRMWDGNGADGIAFCFLDVPPTGFVSGGGVGIPSSSNGVFVILDTYDNGCGTNPEIQIYQGTNYSECGSGMINRATNQSYLRSSSYQTCRIEYVSGAINVYINNTLRLTGNYSSSFIGYMGFTASTGGARDKHSIKNARIFADIATANAGPDITLCSGQSGQIGSANNPNFVYNWTNGQGLNATNVSAPNVSIANTSSTTVTQTYTLQANLAINPNSCPSYDQVNVNVLPLPSRVSFDTICNGRTLNFYGQTLTSPGTYTASINMSPGGCDSLITLNLANFPLNSSSLAATICNGDTYSFGAQTLNAAGNYQQILISSIGCDSIVNLNLIVNPVFASSLNAAICLGETYAFYNQSISVAGNYQHTLQAINGCDSVINLNLTVNNPTLSNQNAAICEGTTYTFFNQSLQVAGLYQHTLQNVYGCDSVINLQLTVNPNLVTQENTSICQGESYSFYGQILNTAGTYQHSLATINGCDSLIVLNLAIIANTTANVQQNICSGDSYDFFGQNLTVAGNYQHLLSNAAGCDSSINLNLSVLNHSFASIQQNICDGEVYSFFGQNLTNNGTYNKILVSSNGCDSTITLNLTVLPVPAAPVISSNSPLLCPGDELKLIAQAVTNGQYSWTGPNNFTSSLTEITFNANLENIGTYEVVVSVNGCTSDPSSLEVKINNIFNFNDFEFPNIITPNGDGLNDELDVESHYHTCLPYTLQLFNRWGNLIFEQTYGGEKFKGLTSNGEKVNPGVYFYRLVFKDGEKNGFIHVMY
jgi:gliding motility-associated-like protein